MNNLGRHVDEGTAKAFPLPTHDLGRQGELSDPLAEIPGEAADLEPGAVAIKLGHGHRTDIKELRDLIWQLINERANQPRQKPNANT